MAIIMRKDNPRKDQAIKEFEETIDFLFDKLDLCRRKKFKLVTDDGDMTKTEFSFDIITA